MRNMANNLKVFIDTNIFLDYIERRPVGIKEAIAIFKLAACNDIHLLVSDLTIANIKYITRKTIPLSEFYRVMRLGRELFSVVPIGEKAIDRAIAIEPKDFEDALQYFSAEQAGADCIITRNIEDFSFSASVKVMTPNDFLFTYFSNFIESDS